MTVGRGAGLGSCPTALHEAYDAGLLDLDGVLYRGSESVEHAASAVAAARGAGMRLAFVTNNASRHPAAVAAQLSELGMPASAEEVVTSGQAAVRTVAARVPAGAAVLVLGTEALAETVAAAGLRPVRRVDQAGPVGVAAVVQGLAPTTSNADLAEAAVALRSGALWVAGNLDPSLPSPRGLLPGNGAFVAVLRELTGLVPVVAGKPDPALHLESVARVQAHRPLVVGDRLDTDILGAVRGDADSLLVLTGVTDLPGLLAAPQGMRPTYVAADLSALGRPQREVVIEADAAGRPAVAICGTARAEVVEGAAVIVAATAEKAAQGDVLAAAGDEALRARTALAWAVADSER